MFWYIFVSICLLILWISFLSRFKSTISKGINDFNNKSNKITVNYPLSQFYNQKKDQKQKIDFKIEYDSKKDSRFGDYTNHKRLNEIHSTNFAR